MDTATWDLDRWATKLSTLLSDRALEVYSWPSVEVAKDYVKVKTPFMKRYVIEERCRQKFTMCNPITEEFIVRLMAYLSHCVELSKTDKSFEG